MALNDSTTALKKQLPLGEYYLSRRPVLAFIRIPSHIRAATSTPSAVLLPFNANSQALAIAARMVGRPLV